MEESIFKFKRFSIHHSKSSMKIGVDAVLLGAWVKGDFKNILDLGTGCGIIPMMLAQRYPEACIMGVDIDEASVEEANSNFSNSIFGKNIKALQREFPTDFKNYVEKYDLIVSNPPFYASGVTQPKTTRERARHQDLLSPFTIIREGLSLLKERGKISMILPSEFIEKIKECCFENGAELTHICYVRNKIFSTEKRILVEIMKRGELKGDLIEERLTLFNEGNPTEKYRALCKDFYLKF